MIVLCALAAGLLFAAETRFAVSRVRVISQVPAEALPQHVLWGTIPPQSERFWPIFWLHRKEYKDLIEAYYPVKVDLSLNGWGEFMARTSALIPAYRVYWGGRLWYLSAEGKLWLVSLAENSLIDRNTSDKRPVLVWGADRATPIDMTAPEGNIFNSSLPLVQISRWYAQLDALRLTPYVRYVQAGVKEGTPVVRLIFYRAATKENGPQFLLPDDAELWAASVLAVRELYGSLENMPPDIFIDCTYKDKILLRNTGEGDKEENKSAGGKR